MCLNNITQKFDPPDETVRRAWKVVHRRYDGLPYPVFRESNIPYTSEWQTAQHWRVFVSSRQAYDKAYDSGFHVFTTKEDAQAAMEMFCDGDDVVPVEVRGVMYEGIDATSSDHEYIDRQFKTWVAREIRLVNEPAPEPPPSVDELYDELKTSE